MPDELLAWSARTEATDAEWFRFTGHCGHCGLWGPECSCTREDPCGCRKLHRPPSTARPTSPVESVPMFGGPDA